MECCSNPHTFLSGFCFVLEDSRRRLNTTPYRYMLGWVKLDVFAKPLNKSADKTTASFLSVVLTLEKCENISATLMSFKNKNSIIK